METKEKAKQLVERFMQTNIEEYTEDEICEEQAKKFALILVDEILTNTETFDDSVWYLATKGFWQEVKDEITQM